MVRHFQIYLFIIYVFLRQLEKNIVFTSLRLAVIQSLEKPKYCSVSHITVTTKTQAFSKVEHSKLGRNMNQPHQFH